MEILILLMSTDIQYRPEWVTEIDQRTWKQHDAGKENGKSYFSSQYYGKIRS